MSQSALLAPDLRPTADASALPPPPMLPPTGVAPHGTSWLWPLLRIAFIAAAGVAAWFIANNWDRWTGAGLSQRTDDAFVAGDLTPLSAKVSGYIATVSVQDFATVRRGDVLAEIEPSDYRAQAAQAEANRAAAQATLANLANQKAVQRALVRQAEATIEAATADVTRAHLEANRQRLLLVGRLAGTPQAVEQSDANEKRSAAQLALSRAALDQQRLSRTA